METEFQQLLDDLDDVNGLAMLGTLAVKLLARYTPAVQEVWINFLRTRLSAPGETRH